LCLSSARRRYFNQFIYTTIKWERAADPNHPSHLIIKITSSD
jgi:hypothetical protein